MMITWREREHEEQDMIAFNDPGTVRALRDCGILKYFKLSGMKQQIELLEFLVRAWDPAIEEFHIKNQVLSITVEDVYFLMVCRGEVCPFHSQDPPLEEKQ